MPPKKATTGATRAATKRQVDTEARSSAAEAARMEAKANRVRTTLAQSRAREAELTRQGYCF